MAGDLILTNTRLVTPLAVLDGTVSVVDGAIAAVESGHSRSKSAIDLDGDFLLPGLVELHTDNLERHLEPRPGVPWPLGLSAVLAHDAQIAAAGITTVLDAVCVGDHRGDGGRRRILADSVSSIGQANRDGLLRSDHLLHLRCEVTDPDVIEMFDSVVCDDLLRLVSVMDHTPGYRQWRDLSVYRRLNGHKGWTDAEFEGVVAHRQELMWENADRHRTVIVDRCRKRAIPLASHDDTTRSDVDEAASSGILISEFPTTLDAAVAARCHGMKIVMGAPNLVRGGSHSGNVPAAELAEADLLDILSSDYVPCSLLHGVFLLHDRAGFDLPRAVATVTANPADAIGLTDRGRIEPGRRGDLVRVRLHDGLPLVRGVWRGGVQII